MNSKSDFIEDDLFYLHMDNPDVFHVPNFCPRCEHDVLLFGDPDKRKARDFASGTEVKYEDIEPGFWGIKQRKLIQCYECNLYIVPVALYADGSIEPSLDNCSFCGVYKSPDEAWLGEMCEECQLKL